MAVPLNQGFSFVERVAPASAGQTLLEYLLARYPREGRAEWERRLAAGELTLGERPAAATERLRPGDRVVWHRPPWSEPEAPLTFEVLHEDDDLLAVEKPSGLPTLPGGGFCAHTLLALVRARTPEAAPMHRLGRGTSGIVLFAKAAAARAAVQEAFRARRVRKVYRALACGQPAQAQFPVTVPIGKVAHPLLGDVFAASAAGREASSHVTVLEQRGEQCLVEVRIDTGRPHQIRIHLAAAGHPLAGDPLYVAGGAPSPGARTLPGETGYLLHAAALSLAHPRTGAPLDLACPPPPPLRTRGEG